MIRVRKVPDVGTVGFPYGVDSIEELSTQLGEIGGQLQMLIRQVEMLQGPRRSLRTLGTPGALCDSVRHAYLRQQLTPREIEVCALLIRGYADGEIARTLGTSLGTIKTHAARVCEKLNLDRKRIPWDFFIRLSIGDDNSLPQPTVEECPSFSTRQR